MRDEYNRRVDLDEFIARWDAGAEDGRHSYAAMMAWYDLNPGTYARTRDADDILDPAGYHLTTREFS